MIKSILPYGLVMYLAKKKQAQQKEALAQKRAGDLLPLNSNKKTSDGETYVNMGCGSNPEQGWVNIDGSAAADIQLFVEADTVLPFQANSVKAIFSEHFLEHIPLNVGRRFMNESFRVLKPGGIFRVVCPDLDVLASMITNKNGDWKQLAQIYENIGDFRPNELTCAAQIINWSFYGHGHCNLYNLEQLKKELENAGFTNVKRTPFGESSIADVAIEKRKGEAFYSLIVEAIKP